MYMKRIEALEILKEYWHEPIFQTKIGMSSPSEMMTLEECLEDWDKTYEKFTKCTTEYIEYMYICVPGYIKDRDKIHEALVLFNLGCGRSKLNKDGMWT